MGMDDILKSTPQEKPKYNHEFANLQTRLKASQPKTTIPAAFKPLVKVIFASSSKHKFNELTNILSMTSNLDQSQYRYQLFKYKDILGEVEFPEEGEANLEKNSRSKALFLREQLNFEQRKEYFVLADDTGLYIDQFPDRFGVRTMRDLKEAGATNYEEINQYLINLTKDLEENKRTAHEEVSLFMIDPAGHEFTSIGRGGVSISPQQLGIKSEGLDRILMAENGQTFAEMEQDERLGFLPRTRAVLNLIRNIKK